MGTQMQAKRIGLSTRNSWLFMMPSFFRHERSTAGTRGKTRRTGGSGPGWERVSLYGILRDYDESSLRMLWRLTRSFTVGTAASGEGSS